ncbi:transposase [Candidatus Kaiserbacteria bacterium]|nr:transposase [Candidatus Kaiserbacteria bacterium]
MANDSKPIQRPLFERRTLPEILQLPRIRPIVAVGAFCLMPNHFHILLQEITEGGITQFMRKVGTGYTMYFNIKNARVGNLFVKPFRSKHIDNDAYLRKVAQYIHLNPAELFEASWKQGKVKDLRALQKYLIEYPYSSFSAYAEKDRTQKNILNNELFSLINDNLPPIRELLTESTSYYKDLEVSPLSQ